MRRCAVVLGWVLAMSALLPAVAVADGLYEARSIVTGMDERSRPDGFRRALGLVLVKVSGNPALDADSRLTGVDLGPLLRGFVYLDRMSDIPKHDEQGSRDRPYDLVVRFDPAAIDGLLRSWGDAAWPVPRPLLAVDVTIFPRRGDAMPLRADTDSDERHRGALLAAAERFGLEVLIPARLPPVLAAPRDVARLQGVLRWSDADAGWVAAWRLEWAGGVREWGVRGVGFDAAYRDGVGGVAAVLSGEGSGRPVRPARLHRGPCQDASIC